MDKFMLASHLDLIVAEGADLADVVLFDEVELTTREDIQRSLRSDMLAQYDADYVAGYAPELFAEIETRFDVDGDVFVKISDVLSRKDSIEPLGRPRAWFAVQTFMYRQHHLEFLRLYDIDPEPLEEAFRSRVNDTDFKSLSEIIQSATKHSQPGDFSGVTETGMSGLGSFDRPIDALRASFFEYASSEASRAYARALDDIAGVVESYDLTRPW